MEVVTLRPADVCRALLSALEAAEGRRRNRKRDQTADAFGLGVKRDLLRRAVDENPSPDEFEAWLLRYPLTCDAAELVGPAQAMARAVFEEWQLAHTLGEFGVVLMIGGSIPGVTRVASIALYDEVQKLN